MTKIETWKVVVFVIGFGIVALFLNGNKIFRPPSRQVQNRQILKDDLDRMKAEPRQVGDELQMPKIVIPLTSAWTKDLMEDVPDGWSYHLQLYGAWAEIDGISSNKTVHLTLAPIGIPQEKGIRGSFASAKFRIANDQHGWIVNDPHLNLVVYKKIASTVVKNTSLAGDWSGSLRLTSSLKPGDSRTGDFRIIIDPDIKRATLFFIGTSSRVKIIQQGEELILLDPNFPDEIVMKLKMVLMGDGNKATLHLIFDPQLQELKEGEGILTRQ